VVREGCRRAGVIRGSSQQIRTAGTEWCLHDHQYLLAWAIQDARDGTVVLSDQATWLASILSARDIPVARLACNLEIASDVRRIR
jgi:hypothetical protein